MSKQIIIIGGGISGLALLHYLKQKYYIRNDVDIKLLEKNNHVGGTIRSIREDEFLFETGPNGFLDLKSRTLAFVKENGLETELIEANKEAAIRYISVKGKLYPVPLTPKDFFTHKLLSPFDKLRVLSEYIQPKGNNEEESVFQFAQRRLGRRFAQLFIDPMVAGIYGGDSTKISLKAAFPRMYALEEEYRSLFKAMLKLKKKENGNPKGTLRTFQKGMGQLIDCLNTHYKDAIYLNQPVKNIVQTKEQYLVRANSQDFTSLYMFDFCAI